MLEDLLGRRSFFARFRGCDEDNLLVGGRSLTDRAFNTGIADGHVAVLFAVAVVVVVEEFNLQVSNTRFGDFVFQFDGF